VKKTKLKPYDKIIPVLKMVGSLFLNIYENF
jgi:hypothetical protein